MSERLEDDKAFYQMDDKEKLNAAEQFVGILIKRHVEEGEYHPDQMNSIAWLIEQAERAQDLEVQIHGHKYHINKLEKQNKRYREAREEIEFLWDRTYKRNANEYEGGRLDGLDIAMNIIDEALEESE